MCQTEVCFYQIVCKPGSCMKMEKIKYNVCAISLTFVISETLRRGPLLPLALTALISCASTTSCVLQNYYLKHLPFTVPTVETFVNCTIDFLYKVYLCTSQKQNTLLNLKL